jgi:hypothetical protein
MISPTRYGDVKVGVWLRAADADEMVLHGVRGCTSYRKGDRLQIGRQGKLVDEKRLGPEYYLNRRQTKAHKGMVSVPLIPRRDGPSQGETIEPSRLCIGVVNIGFEDEPRWLNALRTAKEDEVMKNATLCA